MKRVNLFAGHYGSGKTNVAINYAMRLKNKGLQVVIADLDIVNPYFRTKDSVEELKRAGIDFISSEYAGTNVDFPALPGDLYSLVDRTDRYAVLDVGGDDRGALALGRYKDKIIEENNYDMFFVANMYRPLTKTPELAVEIKEEIEKACGLKFTGIINNSNLGNLTTADDVTASFEYIDKLSLLTGLPVAYLTVTDNIFSIFKSGCVSLPSEEKTGEIFTITLQNKIFITE